MALSIIEGELLSGDSDLTRIWPVFESKEGSIRISLGGILNEDAPTSWVEVPPHALGQNWYYDDITVSTQGEYVLLTCNIPERVLVRFGLQQINEFLEDVKNDRD